MLALKLVLTPTLIGTVSLAQRRWGATVGGLLVGLPLTSGPVAFFLASEHGARFAAVSATGTIAGSASEAGFCLTYAYLAKITRWPAAAAGAVGVFLAATAVLRFAPRTTGITYIAAIAMIALIRHAMRSTTAPGTRGRRTPWWDLPGRMLTASAFVLALTASASLLGPRLSGLLSPLPIYVGVLAAFTQHIQGPQAIAPFMRGVLTGLYAFATFFFVLAITLTHQPMAAAFAAAIIAALLTQGLAIALDHNRRRRRHSATTRSS